jgi:hypothetical protein
MAKPWSDLSANDRSAAGALGYTELLWTTAQKGPSMEARKWLNVLKMSELMAIARESGVQPEQLDDALDEDSPRSVIQVLS